MQKIRAFSLVETLVLVALFLILASMAVPVFQVTLDDAKLASVDQQLQRIRSASDFYRFQHSETWPGQLNGAWSADAFVGQLTAATDSNGAWAAAGTTGFPWGPYLPEGIPANPFNDLQTVRVFPPGNSSTGPDGRTGWIFEAGIGLLHANTTALAPDGSPIYER